MYLILYILREKQLAAAFSDKKKSRSRKPSIVTDSFYLFYSRLRYETKEAAKRLAKEISRAHVGEDDDPARGWTLTRGIERASTTFHAFATNILQSRT